MVPGHDADPARRLRPWTRRSLPPAQRWSLADSGLYWISTFPFRLASLACPLLYWFFGVTVVNATVDDVLLYYVPFNVATTLALNWLSRGLVVPVLNDVGQLLAAWPITRAVALGLARPGPHAFKVTAKGGDRSRRVVQWPIMRPFLALAALTVLGLCSTLWRDVDFDEVAGDGMYVVLFWTLYNLVVLAVAMLACIEMPRTDAPQAFAPERVTARLNGRTYRPWLTSLALGGATLRGLPASNPGAAVEVEIVGLGVVAGAVLRDGADASFVELTPARDQIAPLLARLHTASAAPGTTQGSLDTMLRQLARTFHARRAV